MCKVVIDGETLTIKDIVAVAREDAEVTLSPEAVKRVNTGRKTLQKLLDQGNTIYGVNTGFGELSNVKIPPNKIRQLQTNLIRSHAAGVSGPVKTETTRATMLLRANTLAKGYSGIKLETLQTLIDLLNRKIHPIIPSKGSVGASGDLAPLSHMILVLTGEGKAEYNGKIFNGNQAMKKAGIIPIKLDYKEGLALNNGTQLMTAIAALTVYDAQNLILHAEIAAALTLEALLGNTDAFNEQIHNARPHKGQTTTARHIRELIADSKLLQTAKQAINNHQRPHDPYSLRCIPQVIGAARDTIDYAQSVIEIEINSATDNPLIFPETGTCISGGNFHGQPISIALDIIGIALTTIGNNSERRTARLIDDKLNNGLPRFLIPPQAAVGLNSGYMTAQYTAAALASENKVLAHPASADTIPTSAGFEDFVSMGTTAAHKTKQILTNTEYVVAIELLCAAQAVELRGTDKMAKSTKQAYTTIRKHVPTLINDRVISEDIETTRKLIKQNLITKKIKPRIKDRD
jgi:histidine ammonia-lyase